MEIMLQTQNLCKYFRKQKAVNNVSLNIEKGHHIENADRYDETNCRKDLL